MKEASKVFEVGQQVKFAHNKWGWMLSDTNPILGNVYTIDSINKTLREEGKYYLRFKGMDQGFDSNCFDRYMPRVSLSKAIMQNII